MSDFEIDFFLIDYTSNGGVERVTTSLIRLFNTNNIKVNNLISLYAKNNLPHFDFPKEINYVVLNSSKKKLETQIYNQFIKLNCKKIIFQGDNMTISIAILKAAKKANIIAIPQYHGSPYAYLNRYITINNILKNPLNGLKWFYSIIQEPFKKQKLKKFLLLSNNGVVCVSNGVRYELTEIFRKFPSIKKRLYTIYNPLSFNILSREEDNFSKKNQVVYVSRLESKHKNSFLVIKAWNLITKNHPDWELHILGDGSLKQKMVEFSIKNDINNIYFHGFVYNVSSFLKSTKISVLSSNCEGLGMGVVESISYKNAIVSTKSDGGISDLVLHQFSGLLVPKNDYKLFAKAIELLINDEKLRSTYANNGISLLDGFSDEEIIKKWLNVFKISNN